MAGPFNTGEVRNPPSPVSASAVYVNITWTNGTPNISSSGVPSAFPTLEYLDHQLVGVPTNQSVTGGVLSVASTGNRTTRVFGNSIIDNAMRLDQFSGSNRIKFFATNIYRNTAVGMTTNERIFQYGDQGSSAGQTGGWVARINFSNTTQGKTHCATFALHWGDPHGTPSQDLIAFNSAGTDVLNTNTNGHYVCCAVEKNYSGSNHAIHLFVDNNAVQTVADTNGFPLPGISNVGPGNDSASNGFTIFAQSTNQGTNLLKNASVWPIWIGEALDMTQLLSINTNLKSDITANPF